MNKVMIAIASLMIWAGVSFGQATLQKAFEQENAEAFAQLFDKNVDLYAMNKDKRVSSGEAVATMKGFFDSHTVNSFKLVHSGESRGQGSNYEIHQLSTNKGTYRVYVYYNSDGGNKRISELRIEDN